VHPNEAPLSSSTRLEHLKPFVDGNSIQDVVHKDTCRGQKYAFQDVMQADSPSISLAFQWLLAAG